MAHAPARFELHCFNWYGMLSHAMPPSSPLHAEQGVFSVSHSLMFELFFDVTSPYQPLLGF